MIRLTKTELRVQQVRLAQLEKYLPTLQLKKMLLQNEVNRAEEEILQLDAEFRSAEKKAFGFSKLLSDREAADLFPALKITEVKKEFENIAGIDVPILKEVVFQDHPYFLFDTPVWLDSGISELKNLLVIRETVRLAREKKVALERELREISIRVNLFEKILIPRAEGHIKKIKVFLGDQQLAAICQAKAAKRKILERAQV
jgi:V/A-type H+-transporting ATPase subunit D